MSDSDKTPNSLEPVKKVRVAKMGKWPLYVALFCGLFLGGVLVYSVNFLHNPDEEQATTKQVDITEAEKPLLMGEGKGLSLVPPPGTPAVVTPKEPAPSKNGTEPLVIVQKNQQNQADSYRQEQENLRRVRAQAQLTALNAPLSVLKASETAAGPAPTPTATDGRHPSGTEAVVGGIEENAYNPAADRDKEAFFARSEKDAAWMLPHTRMSGQPLELKTGAVIPGVMMTGINSDLPGNIIAQVSQNVWDTATGRQLLIPQGAKLFGVYDSRVIYGQERVLVAWNRIVFPDGSAITLGAMPGTDMSGAAGYEDQVDNHYFRIFGSAVLMSLVTGGMSYSMDALNVSGNSSDNAPTLQDEMGSALAAQLGLATMQLLQKNLNIKPTLEIRPGYQFNIIVTKDMIFQQPYASRR